MMYYQLVCIKLLTFNNVDEFSLFSVRNLVSGLTAGWLKSSNYNMHTKMFFFLSKEILVAKKIKK